MTHERGNKYVKEATNIRYKGWNIKWTGISLGGINTYVATKEGFKNIGATSLDYLKRVIDYESRHKKSNTTRT